MYQMAIIWWILGNAQSGAGKLVGSFMVMTALPGVLLVRRIGSVVDRISSQKILVRCDVLAAGIVGAVARGLHADALNVPIVFFAGFLAATLQAFLDPTLNKAVGDVVDSQDVEQAVGLLASTQSAANFSGAVLGAVLIEKLGVGGTAGLAALGYLIAAGCSTIARFRFVRAATVIEKSDQLTGWEVVRDIPLLKQILIGFGLVNFFATPTLVVLPVYVKNTLQGSANLLGKLEACLWVGLILGTVIAKGIESKNQIRLGAICLGVFGIALAAPGAVVGETFYSCALFLAGLALGVNNVKFISLFQNIIPQERKGRFFALMQAVIGFTFPVAYFLFGAATDVFSPPKVCLIQGMGVLLIAGYFLWLSQESLEIVQEG